MRNTLVLPLLFVALAIASGAQVMTCEMAFDGPGKESPGSHAPVFELEKPFNRPVGLPGHVLSLLRADKENAEKFEACRSRQNLPDIPAKWFQATEIKLVDDELPGLVVKAANPCLWEKEGSKELGAFWIFRQSPTGYQPLFTAHTQALQVLNTRTNGYPDVCIIQGASPHFSDNVYIFEEGKYVLYAEDSVIVDPPPPPPAQSPPQIPLPPPPPR